MPPTVPSNYLPKDFSLADAAPVFFALGALETILDRAGSCVNLRPLAEQYLSDPQSINIMLARHALKIMNETRGEAPSSDSDSDSEDSTALPLDPP